MDRDVSALMSAIDEVHWEEASLFASMDVFHAVNTSTHHLEESLNADVIVGGPFPTLPHDPCLMHNIVNVLKSTTIDPVGFANCPSEASRSSEKAQVLGGHLKGHSSFPQLVIGLEECKVGQKDHRIRFTCTVKVWKPKHTKRKLVLGMDIGLEESFTLSLCALVGRLACRSRCSTAMEEWVKQNWHLMLGYIPELVSLPRGWSGFVFKNPKDTEKVLNTF